MPVDEELLKALGRLTVNFSSLETFLQFLTWGALGPDQVKGQLVTSQLSFKRLLGLLESLAGRYFPTESRESLAELVKRARRIEERRNVLIHSTWADSSGEITTRFKTTLKGSSFEDVKASDVHALADQIREVVADLMKFMDEYGTPIYFSSDRLARKSGFVSHGESSKSVPSLSSSRPHVLHRAPTYVRGHRRHGVAQRLETSNQPTEGNQARHLPGGDTRINQR